MQGGDLSHSQIFSTYDLRWPFFAQKCERSPDRGQLVSFSMYRYRNFICLDMGGGKYRNFICLYTLHKHRHLGHGRLQLLVRPSWVSVLTSSEIKNQTPRDEFSLLFIFLEENRIQIVGCICQYEFSPIRVQPRGDAVRGHEPSTAAVVRVLRDVLDELNETRSPVSHVVPWRPAGDQRSQSRRRPSHVYRQSPAERVHFFLQFRSFSKGRQPRSSASAVVHVFLNFFCESHHRATGRGQVRGGDRFRPERAEG